MDKEEVYKSAKKCGIGISAALGIINQMNLIPGITTEQKREKIKKLEKIFNKASKEHSCIEIADEISKLLAK